MSARKRPSRKPAKRDTDATPFGAILHELVSRVPGAFGAALVDSLGETVDYTGLVDPFEIRVAAAYLQIALRQIDDFGAFGKTQWLIIRGATKSVSAYQLPDGYVLAVLLRRRAGFTASRRAFASCERALAAEAGWALPAGRKWFAAEVEVDARGRPTRVRPASEASGRVAAGSAERSEEGNPYVDLVVLGAMMGLPARERGFRVRTTAGGAEITLVREARRCWYADEDPSGLR